MKNKQELAQSVYEELRFTVREIVHNLNEPLTIRLADELRAAAVELADAFEVVIHELGPSPTLEVACLVALVEARDTAKVLAEMSYVDQPKVKETAQRILGFVDSLITSNAQQSVDA